MQYDDTDIIMIEYLDIDDISNLSQVSTYYNSLLKNNKDLQKYKDFIISNQHSNTVLCID